MGGRLSPSGAWLASFKLGERVKLYERATERERFVIGRVVRKLDSLAFGSSINVHVERGERSYTLTVDYGDRKKVRKIR